MKNLKKLSKKELKTVQEVSQCVFLDISGVHLLKNVFL
jgi:hypothetical protein